MIPFQLGFRNLIGILLPGAVLTLVIFVSLDVLHHGIGHSIGEETGYGTGPVVVGFLLAAYVLGSVIRLWSADTVDQLSISLVKTRSDPFGGKEDQVNIDQRLSRLMQCVLWTDPSGKTDQEYFDELLCCIPESASTIDHISMVELKDPPADADPLEDSGREIRKGSEEDRAYGRTDYGKSPLILWVWRYDEFPYLIWEIMKIRLYYPKEVYRCFEPYRRNFTAGGGRNKDFFNFCKAAIYEAHEGRRHALAEEVQSAEAQVRFFAGVFWALLLSVIVLVFAALLLVVQSANPVLYRLAACTPILIVLLLAAYAAWVLWRPGSFVQDTRRTEWFWRVVGIAAALLFVWAAPAAFLPGLKAAAFVSLGALAMSAVAFFVVAGGHFRGSRFKEVDTVFDAFYLVQRSSAKSDGPPL